MSPVFLREDGFVFKVHSNEEERRHIHVIKAENKAKIWLEPEIEVAWNDEFRSSELKNHHAACKQLPLPLHAPRR